MTAAEEYGSSLGDTQRSARFLAYPLELDFWTALSSEIPLLAQRAHVVGYSVGEAGRFDEALPWYERTVEVQQKGDIHGRVHHDSLGRSLHQVGNCHFSAGRFDEALPFAARAVEVAQKGDIHGRVHHDSLRISLEAVDVCRTKLGLPPLPDR